jgi:tetratricopeptide (TPR) repeat protein
MSAVKIFGWIILMSCIIMAHHGECQSSVFSILQDPIKLADKCYADGNYLEAIELYENLLNKNSANWQVQLKLAQSYYQVKDYEKSIAAYNSYVKRKGNELPWVDMYHYAEAQTALKNYPESLEYYKRCLENKPDNELVAKKIWRLNNINYLYEDSAHYAVRPMEMINTTYGELCPIPYKDKVVFTSNRREVRAVEKMNGKLNTPFYQLYSISWAMDTTTQNKSFGGKPTVFARSVKSKYNIGPVSFYNNDSKMVFVSSSEKREEGSNHTLGLYFASMRDRKWILDSAYPHNSDAYSINDVTISEDGTRLYFSSDMKGGFGGKDIYTSQWLDGKWSKPRNLGETINTSENEVFPYLHADGTLYFSSNGHAGIGELDIFKAQIKSEGYSEPQNVGYPLNSNYDDFGLSFDSLGTHGYFTSNRKNGGYDDDVYEFDMDLQTYPFTITGVIKFKEHTWSEESTIQVWSKVKIFLMDSWLGMGVYESHTDSEGNFSIVIPYFSKYYIQIVDEEGHAHRASLELQKYRAETNVHEIVIVKDIFKQNPDK